MRLKSAIWVSALLRRCQGEGKFGAVLRKGAEEAGAVFVVINHLDGTYDLLGPPPGPAHDDEGNRVFEKLFSAPVPWSSVSEKIEKQARFDSDLWAVEIEDRTGLAGLS
jgi:hypothetical protein